MSGKIPPNKPPPHYSFRTPKDLMTTCSIGSVKERDFVYQYCMQKNVRCPLFPIPELKDAPLMTQYEFQFMNARLHELRREGLPMSVIEMALKGLPLPPTQYAREGPFAVRPTQMDNMRPSGQSTSQVVANEMPVAMPDKENIGTSCVPQKPPVVQNVEALYANDPNILIITTEFAWRIIIGQRTVDNECLNANHQHFAPNPWPELDRALLRLFYVFKFQQFQMKACKGTILQQDLKWLLNSSNMTIVRNLALRRSIIYASIQSEDPLPPRPHSGPPVKAIHPPDYSMETVARAIDRLAGTIKERLPPNYMEIDASFAMEVVLPKKKGRKSQKFECSSTSTEQEQHQSQVRSEENDLRVTNSSENHHQPIVNGQPTAGSHPERVTEAQSVQPIYKPANVHEVRETHSINFANDLIGAYKDFVANPRFDMAGKYKFHERQMGEYDLKIVLERVGSELNFEANDLHSFFGNVLVGLAVNGTNGNTIVTHFYKGLVSKGQQMKARKLTDHMKKKAVMLMPFPSDPSIQSNPAICRLFEFFQIQKEIMTVIPQELYEVAVAIVESARDHAGRTGTIIPFTPHVIMLGQWAMLTQSNHGTGTVDMNMVLLMIINQMICEQVVNHIRNIQTPLDQQQRQQLDELLQLLLLQHQQQKETLPDARILAQVNLFQMVQERLNPVLQSTVNAPPMMEEPSQAPSQHQIIRPVPIRPAFCHPHLQVAVQQNPPLPAIPQQQVEQPGNHPHPQVAVQQNPPLPVIPQQPVEQPGNHPHPQVTIQQNPPLPAIPQQQVEQPGNNPGQDINAILQRLLSMPNELIQLAIWMETLRSVHDPLNPNTMIPLQLREMLDSPVITGLLKLVLASVGIFPNQQQIMEQAPQQEQQQEQPQEQPQEQEQMTFGQETLNQEPIQQETLEQEALQQEMLSQEMIQQETSEQKTLEQDMLDQETLEHQTIEQETLEQETLEQERGAPEELEDVSQDVIIGENSEPIVAYQDEAAKFLAEFNPNSSSNSSRNSTSSGRSETPQSFRNNLDFFAYICEVHGEEL